MERETELKEKGENYDVVVDIKIPGSQRNSRENPDPEYKGESTNIEELSRVQVNLFNTTANALPSAAAAATQLPDQKQPIGAAVRRRSLGKSVYSKPKSRIVEPVVNKSKTAEVNIQTTPAKSPHILSPSIASPHLKANAVSPKTSVPITPRTPLMAAVGGEDNDDDDDDDKVYESENLKSLKARRSKKVKVMIVIEWIAFVSIMTVLITSLTVDSLNDREIWSLRLYKWCVLILVIFCGRLLTEWFTNTIVFMIEKNFLLKKKVLYFLFGLKKSFRVALWLAFILLAWVLLINRGVERSEETSKVLNYITRFLVSTLVGAVMWMAKTLFVKLVASSFHVRTYFDRIQESIFHQYILQALSRANNDTSKEIYKSGGQLSFNSVKTGKKEVKNEVINVDKLHKMKREKVSAWTMRGLINVVRNSGLPTMSEVLHDSVEEEWEEETEQISSEVEAKGVANRIFKNVAKHGHKYIDEDDLLLYMPKEEVDNAFPLFEGAAESRRITKSSFKNWVVKAYNERKYLAVSLNDAKTAIEELNRIASGLTLVVIAIVWLLLMEITTTRVLVFISSQMLLVVFVFGNTAKSVFEAMIFVFIVHPFDVGDRCVVDGVQMVVEEMNILSTIFLKADNEKVCYPNAVLATKPIGNFNRSPEMGDSVEFAVDFSTPIEKIADMKAQIKSYLESIPQHWRPNHSVQLKEIVEVNKLIMALYVSHTINFQNSSERGNRRSELVFELKKIFERIGIQYHLLPQPVQISYT